MKIFLGLSLALAIGIACRLAAIPLPAPPVDFGFAPLTGFGQVILNGHMRGNGPLAQIINETGHVMPFVRRQRDPALAPFFV